MNSRHDAKHEPKHSLHHARVLFIAKRRHGSGGHSHGHRDGPNAHSSGLRNSVLFVVDLLVGLGVDAKLVEVTDNNDIDREVSNYQPTHCIIEAFWVVPQKFDVLRPLHPGVRWIVRDHSQTAFLAQEGIAIEWVGGYLKRGIEVCANRPEAARDLRIVAHALGVSDTLVTYLPNYYPTPSANAEVPRPQHEPGAVHIGCFGAVRPLKNQLAQAIGAMAFADNLRLKLRFHINCTRLEGRGEPILKNLRSLFAASPRHELVEHSWLDHDGFLVLLRRMDIALQVSLSETFNIVSADAVSVGVPVVASPEVSWLGAYALADPHDAAAISEALWRLWEGSQRGRLFAQRRDLSRFLAVAEALWAQRFAYGV